MMIKMVRVSLAILLLLPAMWGAWKVMGSLEAKEEKNEQIVINSPSPVASSGPMQEQGEPEGTVVSEPDPSPTILPSPTPSPILVPTLRPTSTPSPTIKPSLTPRRRDDDWEDD